MCEYVIRFGSSLKFDSEKEKDLINLMENLNATHGTGKFMSNLIRVAADCPEIMAKAPATYEKGELMKQLDMNGVSYSRMRFFNSVSKDVQDMKDKVDSIYDMCLKMYILAQVGKQIGLEKKSEQGLLASFVLEKQLRELQEKLGENIYNQAFASNKIEDTRKRGDDALQYIIESYDSILNELKAMVNVQTVQIPVQSEVVTIKNEEVAKPVEIKKANTESQTENIDDEIIDFGNADTNALSNFFNL